MHPWKFVFAVLILLPSPVLWAVDIDEDEPHVKPKPAEKSDVEIQLERAQNELAKIKRQRAAERADKPAATPVATGETPQHYNLEVGTFSQIWNAVDLQDRLQKQGFTASIKKTTDRGSNEIRYKVLVGPMPDKAKAQAVKAKLAMINVNSFVHLDE